MALLPLGSVVILGLMAVPAQLPARAPEPDMPLVVSRVMYSPGQCGEFELRNAGVAPVIAWDVSFTFRSSNGSKDKRGLSRDAYGYGHALGTPQVARTLSEDGVWRTGGVLQPGDAVRDRLSCPVRPDGKPHETVEVRVEAVFPEGNRPLGNPASIASIIRWRNKTAQSCAEVATLLREVRAKAGGDAEALQLAAKTLDSLPATPCRGLVDNIRLSLRRIDRGEKDPTRDHLDRYILAADQEAAAARQAASAAQP